MSLTFGSKSGELLVKNFEVEGCVATTQCYKTDFGAFLAVEEHPINS